MTNWLRWIGVGSFSRLFAPFKSIIPSVTDCVTIIVTVRRGVLTGVCACPPSFCFAYWSDDRPDSPPPKRVILFFFPKVERDMWMVCSGGERNEDGLPIDVCSGK